VRALLDVNVLIALLDAGHVHHRLAMDWLESAAQYGWASCPLTQNGCIRIMSNPGYPNPFPASQVATRLKEAAAGEEHEFWPDEVSLLDTQVFNWSYVLAHRQVTDMYLLALAVSNRGRLVTFDRGIGIEAVKNAGNDNLLILA
jgi:toxin-antitoxin system PIN domain toxin